MRVIESGAVKMGERQIIQVLLADDHSAIREGIRTYIARQKGIKVVGEASGGEETIWQTNRLRPDILILDVAMPRVNGVDVAKQVRRMVPETRIIALSVYDNNEYVAAMVRSGAMGYVSKNDPPATLVQAIRAVHTGETYFTSSAAQVLLDDYVKHAETIGEASELSVREKEILVQIVDGCTNREIAEQLQISRRTVETHRQHIRKKLGLETTADLIRYAVVNGIVAGEAWSYT
jgi:DNA-binding NarL/FixJ family response regulator